MLAFRGFSNNSFEVLQARKGLSDWGVNRRRTPANETGIASTPRLGEIRFAVCDLTATQELWEVGTRRGPHAFVPLSSTASRRWLQHKTEYPPEVISDGPFTLIARLQMCWRTLQSRFHVTHSFDDLFAYPETLTCVPEVCDMYFTFWRKKGASYNDRLKGKVSGNRKPHNIKENKEQTTEKEHSEWKNKRMMKIIKNEETELQKNNEKKGKSKEETKRCGEGTKEIQQKTK